MDKRSALCLFAAFALAWFFPLGLPAQAVSPSLYAGMRWRLIGPFRGGRVTSVAGVPGNPAVYYFGTPGGGVWKTTDGGWVYKPIFDQEKDFSIGALALAPSNPNIVYVGTGEQAPGHGIYRSDDGGQSWRHLGLRRSRHITILLVDPRHPNIVLAGVEGSLFHKGGERGVYRSTDGGKTWKQVLFHDAYTGIVNMAWDPRHPKTVYAAMMMDYAPLPGVKLPEFASPESAIYKSTDEGRHWRELPGQGLPPRHRGRIGLTVVPGHKNQVFAIMTQGLYRSENGGKKWMRITTDPRIKGNWYFSRVFAASRRVIYVMQTSMYRSTDGGRTFHSFKGAPGGDDNHILWIDPNNPNRIMLGSDQGATITNDGGRTWSPWYNQPTGQFYQVSTDNFFPYTVYGAQQDSGTAGVLSRSNYGEISFRDWMPIGGFEYCYIAPDPLHPRYVYSGGWFGSAVRFDRLTGEVRHIFEKPRKDRTAWAPDIIFSPFNPHRLYLGTQYLLTTVNGGQSWQTISPDLTWRPSPPAPAAARKSAKKKKPPLHRGFIEAIAPSSLQKGLIWVGTSNGLIQLTRNAGQSWQNVTPPGMTKFDAVEILDASDLTPGTAYAAVSTDQIFTGSRDRKPYIYRTHDYGRSWRLIVSGLPASQPVLAVRADPRRAGLLYAGTAGGVYVSFDDGAHWQSLRLNAPHAQFTDLDVHGNDLVASTFGRGLWILDDVTPLRQIQAALARQPAYFFKPETALRVRWDQDQDTPLPPEVPAGQNPPNGAILYYYLKTAPSQPVTLTISNAWGVLIRGFSSVLAPHPHLLANVPHHWIEPETRLPAGAGTQRFVWDLRQPPPRVLNYGYFGERLKYEEYTLTNDAINHETPRHFPRGALVVPGVYTLRLTVAGHTYTRHLTVREDPRVKATTAQLRALWNFEQKIDAALASSRRDFHAAHAAWKQLLRRRTALGKPVHPTPAQASLQASMKSLAKALGLLLHGTLQAPGLGPLNMTLARYDEDADSAETAPLPGLVTRVRHRLAALSQHETQWAGLQKQLRALSHELQAQKLKPLSAGL